MRANSLFSSLSLVRASSLSIATPNCSFYFFITARSHPLPHLPPKSSFPIYITNTSSYIPPHLHSLSLPPTKLFSFVSHYSMFVVLCTHSDDTWCNKWNTWVYFGSKQCCSVSFLSLLISNKQYFDPPRIQNITLSRSHSLTNTIYHVRSMPQNSDNWQWGNLF